MAMGKWLYDSPTASPPPTSWDRKLASGLYKPVESDYPDGPWSDCEVLDNGDVRVRKRYQRIVKKEEEE